MNMYHKKLAWNGKMISLNWCECECVIFKHKKILASQVFIGNRDGILRSHRVIIVILKKKQEHKFESL